MCIRDRAKSQLRRRRLGRAAEVGQVDWQRRGGRRRHALLLHAQYDALDAAAKADAGRGRAADVLGQTVVCLLYTSRCV